MSITSTTDTDLQLVQNEVQNLKSKLEAATKTLVVYDSAVCSLDQVAMATSFYLALKSRGAQVSILSLGDPVVAHSSLVGIDEVVTQLPQEGLVITLDNSDAGISNVSCDADEITKTLKIYVHTVPGQGLIAAEKIQMTPCLAKFDQIIAIGIPDVNTLSNFGLTDLTDDHLTTFADPKLAHSQLLANLFRHWLWTIDADIATNLLMGIDEQTANFSQPDISAEVFEIAGWLLRSGGRRYLPELQQRQQQPKSEPFSLTPSFLPVADSAAPFTSRTPASSTDKKKAFYYKKRGQAQGQAPELPRAAGRGGAGRTPELGHRPEGDLGQGAAAFPSVQGNHRPTPCR